MAQSSEAPKFGDWVGKEDVPYTDYFEKEGKGRRGANRKPNDPRHNSNSTQTEPMGHKLPEPEIHTGQEEVELKRLSDSSDSTLHSDTASQRVAVDSSRHRHGRVGPGSNKSESETPKGPETLRPRHERRPSREEGDLRKATDSPLRHDAVGRRATVDPPHHRHGGASTSDGSKRATRQITGSDRSIEQSPLHPNHQARVVNKGSGVSSPSSERRGLAEGGHGVLPTTPGRSRLRSVARGDETLDDGPTVPVFGAWNDNDPSSAEGFTEVFERVRDEKNNAGRVPQTPTASSYSNGQRRSGNKSSKGCLCFPWGRK